MDAERASRTAIATAYFRAHHYVHANPKIFEDPLAGSLLHADDVAPLERFLLAGVAKHNPELAASGTDRDTLIGLALRGLAVVLARARFAEERLAEAMREGTAQYVIIGAGLDTFALRRPDLRERLHVIEIDHPATQAFKRARIRDAGLEEPPNLHFAPADLERENLAEVLSRTPYDRTRPAFFSWLGVTMYLTDEAIRATLRSLRSVAAAGSQLAFDYLDRAAFVPGNPLADAGQALRDRPARGGAHDLRLRSGDAGGGAGRPRLPAPGGPGAGAAERAVLSESLRRASADGHGPSRPCRGRLTIRDDADKRRPPSG